MDMKIYVANLAKYNNMETSGEWFDLPVDMEEVYETIFDEDELDENGQPYGDYAIHDYELPFEISEQENIDNLNEFAEYIQDIPEFEPILKDNYDIQDVINLAHQTGNEELVEGIVDNEMIDDIIKNDIEQGNGWERVSYFLRQVEWTDGDYYELDGYGNLTDLAPDRHVDIKDDIMDNVKHEFDVENRVNKNANKSFVKNDEMER